MKSINIEERDAAEEEEPKQKKGFRFSLKWEWTLSTAFGVLIIFAAIVFLIFSSFMTVLMRQEKTHVADSLNVVVERLSNQGVALTDKQVDQLLRPRNVLADETSGSQQGAPYNNAVVTTLARDSQTVTVYDTEGKALFSTGDTTAKFRAVDKQHIAVTTLNHRKHLVGRMPIHSKENDSLLGYVQVTDNLKDYRATQVKLFQVAIVLGLIAGLAVAILSYILASFLLRPVEAIRETIHAVRDDPQTDKRVPEIRHTDELSDLGNLFNGMLDTTQGYMDQQQQFVEDVSHELRTPVAIIQGHMEMLDRWGKDDPEVLDESIKASLQETKRMKSLVQEMLDLQRAEQIEVNYTNEVTDVSEVVQQVYDNFKMIHPDFVFILDDDVQRPVQAQVYRNHLEQILIILLDNAVKYTQTRKEIHLTFESDSRNVEVAVQDFGEGISQENRDRVFNRFYRVDKARSRTKGGNGLGLAIAKRLIEAYHGKITIESAVGYGSVFRISLPILSDEDARILNEKKERAQAEANDTGIPGIKSALLEDSPHDDVADNINDGDSKDSK
ncbi:HAMP domain-containing sensor histidine kinase [Levilactobacillus parabrevis]|uniref:Signal transduction histidine-protein kinase ArlS n=1 Tax=Levilactobacillus parabrevis ATCC 53295 TaxID=1267003 RepID=A0A0R1GN98_9LACO|nr:HAMP domain-containing histidine kinase [Levilactobacillus parabrevis]KRK35519.1 Signal transduction histidine kinase [Levilactobacillus parabrevis ATCC 53295]KRO05264.1 Signal transduction histidine kinase [Levilactobacillus parabrevis]